LLEKMGGATLIGEDRENLCRRARPDEQRALGAFDWVIECQGLPNLVHEVIHALFLGRLADDHGFDYGQIPLDLRRPEHRRCLWEELACCVISAVLCAPFEPDPEQFARDWFAEQFEIQGIFHGLEDDLAGFTERIAAELDRPEGQRSLAATVDRGRELLRLGLAEVGVVGDLPACDAIQLWRRYRGL